MEQARLDVKLRETRYLRVDRLGKFPIDLYTPEVADPPGDLAGPPLPS